MKLQMHECRPGVRVYDAEYGKGTIQENNWPLDGLYQYYVRVNFDFGMELTVNIRNLEPVHTCYYCGKEVLDSERDPEEIIVWCEACAASSVDGGEVKHETD